MTEQERVLTRQERMVLDAVWKHNGTAAMCTIGPYCTRHGMPFPGGAMSGHLTLLIEKGLIAIAYSHVFPPQIRERAGKQKGRRRLRRAGRVHHLYKLTDAGVAAREQDMWLDRIEELTGANL